MYASNAFCCASSSTSQVVERNTTVLYRARLSAVNAPASSVAVTANLSAAPSARMAAMPAGIDAWRNPSVLEKTSTLYGAAAAVQLDEAPRPPAASRPTVAAADHERMVMTVPST